MIHITNYKSLKLESERVSSEGLSYIHECSELEKDLSRTISRHMDKFSPAHFTVVQKEVMEHAKHTINKVNEKLRAESEANLLELGRKMESEKNNCMKGIMEFLSLRLLKENDSNIILELSGDSYEAKAIYYVESGIEYSFKIDPSKQQLFERPLRFSSLEKGVRIPIHETVHDIEKGTDGGFEKIDRYILTKATIAGGRFLAIFNNPEGNSGVTFSMPRGDMPDYVSIEFFDGKNTIDITGSDGLSKKMDIERIQEPLDRIYGTMMELECDRVEITGLKMGGQDIIESKNFSSFILKLFELKSAEIREALNSMRNTGGSYSRIEIESMISKCGDSADKLRKIIGA
jgi:hypothetical protein